MIILALQDVRKSFGTHEVLKSVSFTLQEGERMGMVGVNGSGKSTLMKIIAGLESADSGSVNMQKGLRIGYLAQQGGLTGEETVLETLESVFEPQRRMEAEMRALEQEMAVSGTDPDALRILGDHGHLSNEARTSALLRLINAGTGNVILGHLSGENNTPLLARRTSADALTRERIQPDQDISLQVALRDEVGGVYILKERA